MVGFDSGNARVWESFSSSQSADLAISSWFDHVHPEQMGSLFPLFVKSWKSSEQWQECLSEVIYWYVNGNTAGGVPGIDVSILLSQAALERLAHQFVVVDCRLISADGFKSPQLKASDKLRLLLSSLQVPIDIPAAASDIKGNASQFRWVDGPHAVSDAWRGKLVARLCRPRMRIAFRRMADASRAASGRKRRSRSQKPNS